MPIEKGEIVGLKSYNGNMLYIQQKNELSITSLKDRIEYKEGDVYLGTADLFDRPPMPIKSEDGSSIYCDSVAHLTVLPAGLS